MLDIALVQWKAGGNDRAKQLARAIDATRQAAAEGADIVVFPEAWLISYSSNAPEYDDRPDLWRNPARGPAGEPIPRLWDGLDVSLDSAEITTIRELARELNVAVLFTFLQTWEGGPRNSSALIDRHGEIKLVYAKVHLCVFSVHENGLTAGDDFPVAELDTAQGPVKIGVMICYDREFPESARLLMLNGAEIVLVPNACDMEPNRLMQFRTRATENMTAMAMANYAGPGWGKSCAFDGIAFDDSGSRDTTVLLAGEEETIAYAHFDLDALRDYRSRETWGNAFRRPEMYGQLTERHVQPPFVRTDAHGTRWDSRDTRTTGKSNDL
ncbi:MAG: carbon-nitrogen hydrolase family protein [Thermomicrobiales bacterium]